jgi:PDZ domain-containing protein
MSASNSRTPLMVFAAIVVVYGIFGWLDVANYAQGGWATDPASVVTQVLPGSPAEAGGLQVGDKITSLGGIASTDADAQARRNRPKVGETWEFVVQRDGAEVALDVTFGEPVPQRKFNAHASFVVGFCFIGFTLWAYMQKQTESTAALLLAGTAFSLVFIGGPYFESFTVRSLGNLVSAFIVWFGIAAILNFLLVHLRSGGNRIYYIPALAASIFIGWRILARPEATDALNNFANVFIGAIAAFYLIFSLVTVYRGYSGASASERSANGLNLMLIGAVVGFLPTIIGIVAGIVSPQTVLPGQNFYLLSFVAIPITWSMAVLKGGAAAD